MKDRFLKEYHGHIFEDWGSNCSKDFKTFARKFRNYLERMLPIGVEIVGHHCGHYYLFGFICSEQTYIYYSYSWDRFSGVDVTTDSIRNGVLVRYAKSDSDYRGETNEFTSIEELPEKIIKMLERRCAA